MSDSILTSVKKVLNLPESYTAFDEDVLMHINSVFSTINQLGIGPEGGLTIANATPTWAALIGTDPRLNFVKSYVYLRVRMLFDPPTTSFHIAAVEKQYEELEWRMSVYRESTEWTDPTQEFDPEDQLVLDGGTP